MQSSIGRSVLPGQTSLPRLARRHRACAMAHPGESLSIPLRPFPILRGTMTPFRRPTISTTRRSSLPPARSIAMANQHHE
jgi:hypothetical protein